MEEAALADRLILMDQGRVAMEGAPREVFARVEAVRALGLDVPEMAELGQRLNKRGLELPEGILTTREMVVALCRLKSGT
jgi:energy-coupling factor transport system ATP-binding protein